MKLHLFNWRKERAQTDLKRSFAELARVMAAKRRGVKIKIPLCSVLNRFIPRLNRSRDSRAKPSIQLLGVIESSRPAFKSQREAQCLWEFLKQGVSAFEMLQQRSRL
jgi:hypothetical protein